jgi:hypothetical protein
MKMKVFSWNEEGSIFLSIGHLERPLSIQLVNAAVISLLGSQQSLLAWFSGTLCKKQLSPERRKRAAVTEDLWSPPFHLLLASASQSQAFPYFWSHF